MTIDGRPPGLSKRGKVLLLLALFVAGGIRWHHAVLENQIKPDETVYVNAAQFWSQGRSPYEENGFFYTPLFASISSSLTGQFGTLGYLKIQRTLHLVGICVATWLAVLLTAWRWWPALLVSIAWIWLSPVVALPVEIGNATGLSTALTLASLYVWSRQPFASGTALGLGQALKPIAPLAPFCLLAYRQGPEPQRAFKAGVTSLVALAILLLIGLRFLPGIWSNALGSSNPYNFSLQHVLSRVGVHIRPVWVTAMIGSGGLWWIATRQFSRLEFLVATLSLNLFAAPILWAHSLLLFFPVHLLAAERMARSLPGTSGVLAASPHIVAGLAIVSTVFTSSIGGLLAAPDWIQGAVLAVPLLSLPYLGVYVLNGLRSRNGPAQRRPSQPG
jgi:hypothetical protein